MTDPIEKQDMFIRLVQLIRDQEDLGKFVAALGKQTDLERNLTLTQLITQMQQAGEDANVIACFELLRRKEIFDKLMEVL